MKTQNFFIFMMLLNLYLSSDVKLVFKSASDDGPNLKLVNSGVKVYVDEDLLVDFSNGNTNYDNIELAVSKTITINIYRYKTYPNNALTATATILNNSHELQEVTVKSFVNLPIAEIIGNFKADARSVNGNIILDIIITMSKYTALFAI